MGILQFSEHFQLIFDNSNVNKDKQIKQNYGKVFRIIKFFFLILLRKATLESKFVPTNRNSSAFLLHTSKTCSNFKLFSIFSQSFLDLIFAIKIKNVVETIRCFFYQLSTKYCIYYVSEHLKYCTEINEYWLSKIACLNIVLCFYCAIINWNFIWNIDLNNWIYCDLRNKSAVWTRYKLLCGTQWPKPDFCLSVKSL